MNTLEIQKIRKDQNLLLQKLVKCALMMLTQKFGNAALDTLVRKHQDCTYQIPPKIKDFILKLRVDFFDTDPQSKKEIYDIIVEYQASL